MNIEQKKIESPFTVPENYFGEMEENILSRVNIESLQSITKPETPKDFFAEFGAKYFFKNKD